MNEKWFFMPIGEVEKKLKTKAASGLNLKAAKARLAKDEPFFRVRKRNIGLLIVDLFADFFLLLLTLVSFFALFRGRPSNRNGYAYTYIYRACGRIFNTF